MDKAEAKQSVKILRGARRLLIEKGHTKGAYARNSKGRPVVVQDPDAQCFCALGAVVKAAGKKTASPDGPWGNPGREVRNALSYLVPAMLGKDDTDSTGLYEINDYRSTTPEKIVTAFDFAIHFAKEDTK
jgi:hypothetical protein